MSIKELIINKVNAINNTKILKEILNLISTESETEEIYQFSDEEKKLVFEGINDADSGNSYNQQESDKIISKWFEEKLGGLLER